MAMGREVRRRGDSKRCAAAQCGSQDGPQLEEGEGRKGTAVLVLQTK